MGAKMENNIAGEARIKKKREWYVFVSDCGKLDGGRGGAQRRKPNVIDRIQRKGKNIKFYFPSKVENIYDHVFRTYLKRDASRRMGALVISMFGVER